MAQLAREVTDLPLLLCGGIYDRASAEAVLQDVDIVLSGKSLMLNLNWVEDVRQNKMLERFQSEDANIAYTPEPLP